MSKLIMKTQPMATNISLENFSTETQNILQPYITPYLSCKIKKKEMILFIQRVNRRK